MTSFDTPLNFKEYFEKSIRFSSKMAVKDHNIFFNWDCSIPDIPPKTSVCYTEQMKENTRKTKTFKIVSRETSSFHFVPRY